MIDCGKLWEQFTSERYADRIPNKVSDDVFAVYHSYEGDHTAPYHFFIGCHVQPGTPVPEQMNSMMIKTGKYQKFTVKGKIPDCIADAWYLIWSSDIPRAYGTDFEMYGAKSRDWNQAEIEIFISIK
jgi:predicted transcriptional regulator YdeE